MRLRSTTHDRATDSSGTDSTDGPSFGGRLVGFLLVAGGIAAFAYVLARILGSSDDGPARSVDELRERADDAVPDDLASPLAEVRDRADDAVPVDGARIPIGEPGEGEGVDEEPRSDATEGDVRGLDGADANADYTDEPRSDAEITERAASDVQEEPAEPGEMTIDDEVAEDLTDADDEPGSGSDDGSTEDETDEE